MSPRIARTDEELDALVMLHLKEHTRDRWRAIAEVLSEDESRVSVSLQRLEMRNMVARYGTWWQLTDKPAAAKAESEPLTPLPVACRKCGDPLTEENWNPSQRKANKRICKECSRKIVSRSMGRRAQRDGLVPAGQEPSHLRIAPPAVPVPAGSSATGVIDLEQVERWLGQAQTELTRWTAIRDGIQKLREVLRG